MFGRTRCMMNRVAFWQTSAKICVTVWREHVLVVIFHAQSVAHRNVVQNVAATEGGITVNCKLKAEASNCHVNCLQYCDVHISRDTFEYYGYFSYEQHILQLEWGIHRTGCCGGFIWLISKSFNGKWLQWLSAKCICSHPFSVIFLSWRFHLSSRKC